DPRRPRRCGLADPRPAPRPRGDPDRGRQPLRRGADARDGGRVLGRPPAVRPADRLLPGAEAHGGGDGRRCQAGALARLVRRVRLRPSTAGGVARGRDREGAPRRRLQRDREPLGADARRHRVHVGARPAPLVQARALERRRIRRPDVPPRATRRARRLLTLAFVYLHGFASGPGSTKAQFFRARFSEQGETLEIPELAPDFTNMTITGMLAIAEPLVAREPAVILGSSLGGYLATLVASRHPDRI